MTKKQAEKTVSDYLYDYQTRLQGVANDLGVRLSALLFTTDAKVLSLLRKELPKYKRGALAEMKRLEKIIGKIEAVRDPSYSAAKDLILETSADIVQAATTETAKEFNRTIAEQRQKIREKRFCKELTKKQQESIIDGQGIDGATIPDWFWKWKRDDLERLASLTKRASVERMSLAEITRAAKGSIENNYADGVFTESKVSAARMARTIVNGVSNNARVETIVQNSDVIDGVKFVGTLDGKTCPYCASYDGYIWRGEEIAEARRPPIHPNCRCCLIPYVELKDEEGNVVDVDGERPAANADFDKLAQDAYNERAREKGWKRRWDDLSPSTRLKYYYQAQKDYEAETGKPAYRQVSGSTTFQEYFHRQPDSFKRAWLGAKRYELYKSGKLKEKNIFKPDLTYQVSAESLVRDGVRSIAQETVETILGKATKKERQEISKHTTRNDSELSAIPQTDQNENVQAKQTHSEEYEQSQAERRKQVWEQLLPINDENSDNHIKVKSLYPQKFDGKKKDTQNTKEGAKIGLRFIARFCDNWGIDVDELNNPIFNQKIKNRAKYHPENNSISMSLYDKKEGSDSAASDTVHELGHVIEYQTKGDLRTLLQDFYESITKRDVNDDIVYVLNEDGTIENDEGYRFRELTIPVPEPYTRKEYLDKLGNLDGTELFSTYVELMYSTPWYRQDHRYKAFFEGVEKCLKQSRNSK